MKQKKSTGLKVLGLIGILSIACCAIAWIGLIISPPWEAQMNAQCDASAE